MGSVDYVLSNNPNSAFSIDSDSGQIFTAQSLDSDTDTNYTIGVSAFENEIFLERKNIN